MNYTRMRHYLEKLAQQDPWAYSSAQAMADRKERSQGQDRYKKYKTPVLVGTAVGVGTHHMLKDKYNKVLRAPDNRIGKKINTFMDRKNLKLTGANTVGLGTGLFAAKKYMDFRKKRKKES